MIASARQPSRSHKQRVPHLPKPVTNSRSHDLEHATAAVPAACLAPKTKTREEAANARATSRAIARFWMFPPGDPLSRITGCRWLTRNHRAESGTLTFR